MASFFSYLFKHPIPSKKTIVAVYTQKNSVYTLFVVLLSIITLITLGSLFSAVLKQYTRQIPDTGGSLVEGFVGAPQLTNPLENTTIIDQALTQLTYAGLLKRMPDNSLLPEIATGYTVSSDGKTYTFTLNNKAVFSNKKPVTSADVLYTVEQLRQLETDGKQASFWNTVTVSTPDEHTVTFTANNTTSTTLLDQLTFPIFSKESPVDQYTFRPIGAGPFTISDISYNGNYIPESITLTKNKHYVLGAPLLKNLSLVFFASQNDVISALEAGTIDMTADITANTLTPAQLLRIPDKYQIVPTTNGKTIALYRLKTETIFAKNETKKYLNEHIDKNKIVAIVGNGYGIPDSTNNVSSATTAPKSFAIAVENDTTTLAVALELSNQLAAIGITAAINVFDPGTFQEAVRQQRYNIILAVTPDVTVPNGYEIVAPLYTQTIPYIVSTQSGNTEPASVKNRITRYATAPSWYSNTTITWKQKQTQ